MEIDGATMAQVDSGATGGSLNFMENGGVVSYQHCIS